MTWKLDICLVDDIAFRRWLILKQFLFSQLVPNGGCHSLSAVFSMGYLPLAWPSRRIANGLFEVLANCCLHCH